MDRRKALGVLAVGPLAALGALLAGDSEARPAIPPGYRYKRLRLGEREIERIEPIEPVDVEALVREDLAQAVARNMDRAFLELDGLTEEEVENLRDGWGWGGTIRPRGESPTATIVRRIRRIRRAADALRRRAGKPKGILAAMDRHDFDRELRLLEIEIEREHGRHVVELPGRREGKRLAAQTMTVEVNLDTSKFEKQIERVTAELERLNARSKRVGFYVPPDVARSV